MSINYAGVRRLPDRKRVSERLLRLRNGSLKAVRAQRDDSSFLLATWNLRDFDSDKFGWPERLTEAFYYIAETISCFDLVAVQEVKQDVDPLERLVNILGRSEWDYLLTDATEGSSGNGERMAFLYRRSKVRFRRIAGEVVLPQGQLIVAPEEVDPKKVGSGEAAPEAAPDRLQFARSPYVVAFQSGWFHFSLCTVHIYYGAEEGAKLKRRAAEIRQLSKFFADRQDREVKAARAANKARGLPVEDVGRDPGVENYILLGDFNVVSPEHETMQALESRGFMVPEAIDGDHIPDRDHFYDQIAVRVKDDRFKVTAGGIVPRFADVFTDDDEPVYRKVIRRPEGTDEDATGEQTYRDWRSWQISDHSLLWIKIESDFADDYLDGLGDD
ncbi:MAG TPA: endonuclease/exonuclease/phosphatase family protein [Nocardioides sp.]|nr:endonuclease/exonuclease/phosphatase family protein [Nocardioides sp.]